MMRKDQLLPTFMQCANGWRGSALIALLAASLAVSGCKPAAKSPKTTGSGSNQVQKSDLTRLAAEEPVVIDSLTSGAAGDRTPQTEADLAWRALVEMMQTPDPPDAWMTKEPSKEEVEAFKRQGAAQLGQAAEKARDFYTRFPKHENAAEACKQEYNLLSVAVQLGDTNRLVLLQKLETERLKDPKLTEDDRLELRLQQWQRAAMANQSTNRTAVLTELEKGVRVLQKEFPKRSEVLAAALSVAENWLEENEPDKGRALATEVAGSEAAAEVKEAARGLLKKLERLGKPLELKFTALDGREVDLQKLKGKVVLVDFWATWCRPCLVELPSVKAAYEKLHPKGFEIFGISFDQEKAPLEKVVAREKIAWPQQFDDNPDGNRFGEQFGISSIPTMWLVDKKGLLRDLNAREKLAEKVEKLLAE